MIMRYLLQDSLCTDLYARQKYIYQTLALWNVVSSHSSGFIHLKSVPTNCLDILFIVGHNYVVKGYLQSSEIPEKTIVAITCDGSIRFSSLQLSGKTIYIPHQNNRNYADLISGKYYGFDFDLTESEILFFNSKKNSDILQRLDSCFTKL